MESVLIARFMAKECVLGWTWVGCAFVHFLKSCFTYPNNAVSVGFKPEKFRFLLLYEVFRHAGAGLLTRANVATVIFHNAGTVLLNNCLLVKLLVTVPEPGNTSTGLLHQRNIFFLMMLVAYIHIFNDL